MLISNMKFEILFVVLNLALALSAPSGSDSWVAVSEDSDAQEPTNKEDGPKVPKIYSMKVDTNVTNRFAKSLVTSKVKNLDTNPQEATFSVVLPDTAYITGFTMEIDGKKYVAYIQEKEKAKQTYDQAVSSGFAAGHVAVNARDSNKFTVSVNIMPESKATFYLTYEELLTRQKDLYDIVINLHPGQPVKDMEAQIFINETRPLASVTTPSLRSGNELSKNNEIIDPKAVIERIGNNAAKVTFKPDMVMQKEFAKELGTEEKNGFSGQFVVQYDVERDPQGGELLFEDGYFVHFFAPKDAKPEPKHITFVLDTSGSMWGRRIAQLKEAMKSILDQLKPEDSFNIIDFNSGVNVWNIQNSEVQYQEGGYYSFFNSPKIDRSNQVIPDSFEMSEKNIENAKKIVNSFNPSGGTNIETALDVALKLHKNSKLKDERQPMIMFLTDGQATVGQTNSDLIVSKVSKENIDEIPIISISFGDQADKKLLQNLSLKNQGLSKHIYEGADADLQLKSFYELVSTPLFNKIKFQYVGENFTDATKTDFPIFFKGSELVVAGKYKTPAIDPGFAPRPMHFNIPLVRCYSGSTLKEFKPTIAKPMGSLEKHWAYLTLKQLLKERDAADKKEELTKKALDLALKYSFVTPVSSLVVVKPNNTESESDIQDASKGNGPPIRLYRPISQGPGSSLSGPRFSSSGFTTPRFSIPAPYPSGYYARGPPQFPTHMISQTNHMLSFDTVPMISHTNHIISFDTEFDSFPKMITSTGTFSTNGGKDDVSTTERIKPSVIATIEKMKQELPWFGSIYHAENGTISLPQGEFLIGNNDPVLTYPECPKTPVNGTGHCVLLIKCPQVHNLLKSSDSYGRYFCPLGKYAGVCCPDPKKV